MPRVLPMIAPEQALREERPIIDVRAPAEYQKAHFPQAESLPLMTDEERHQVGLCYKRKGRDKAIALGHELVSGEVRSARTQAWCDFAAAHPNAVVSCWRGGMRSQLVAEWMAAEGHERPVVEGGFKALRHAALAILEHFAAERDWLVLGGRTGVGKTLLLPEIADAIDLEGHAEHRGSAFGSYLRPQPGPVTLDNRLAMAAIRHQGGRVVVEDESSMIGSLPLPKSWFAAMGEAPVVVLRVPMEERVANIEREYVTLLLERGVAKEVLLDKYRGSLQRIRKRLGGEKWQLVDDAIVKAFDSDQHDEWIRILLEGYYDRMYDYQLEKKRDRVVFEGDTAAVREYLLTASS